MARNDPRRTNLNGPDPKRGAGDSKSEARQRAARLAQDQARARKRRLLLVQGLIGLVVVVVVVAATVFVLSRDDSGSGGGSATAPPQVTSDGSFVVGDADAPVTIQMVEDFQCPICREFESTNKDLLAGYAAGKDVKLEYRGIAFLDRMSSTDYSTRALNASACVMGQGAEVWSAFHQALYEQQPPEQGDGLTDAKIIDIAKTAGADAAAITPCVQDEKYADWVKATTDKSGDDGVDGTPTIFVNGTKLSGFDGATIKAAVDKALAK